MSLRGPALLRVGLLASTAALAVTALTAAPAAARAPAHARADAATMAGAAKRQPVCDPYTSYKISKNEGYTWSAFDSGTIVNKSSKSSISKTITHSESHSKSTTKSAEVGLSIKAWVAEINGKYGYSVSQTVSYTTSTAFTVTVPPKSTVKYKDGIIVRKFQVKIVHTFSDCDTKTTYGHVYAADNRSEIKDA